MSVAPESPSPAAAPAPRGFVYFCEERRQFYRGIRAWLFWAPYLAGIVLLEPKALFATREGLGVWQTWLPLLAFLVLFPPVGRRLLRMLPAWRNRAEDGND